MDPEKNVGLLMSNDKWTRQIYGSLGTDSEVNYALSYGFDQLLVNMVIGVRQGSQLEAMHVAGTRFAAGLC